MAEDADTNTKDKKAKGTGYWKVTNPWLTPKNKRAPGFKKGDVVATADLDAPKGLAPDLFARELVMLGAIEEAPAPEPPKKAAAPTPEGAAQ